MERAEKVKSFLQSNVGEFRDNTSVIDNMYLLNIKNITDAVLLLYAQWSHLAKDNCTETLRTLYKIHYPGEIIIIDVDCMTPEFQISNFGEATHGWGEIYIVQRGEIVKKFLGKDSLGKYKDYLNTI
jgi:hypothetical protein